MPAVLRWMGAVGHLNHADRTGSVTHGAIGDQVPSDLNEEPRLSDFLAVGKFTHDPAGFAVISSSIWWSFSRTALACPCCTCTALSHMAIKHVAAPA